VNPSKERSRPWDEFNQHVRAGACLAALVKLGEWLLRCEAESDPATCVELEEQIKVRVDSEVLQKARLEAADSQRRAMRILSIGSSFTWEELVLVITLRMEVALALRVLAVVGEQSTGLDLTTFDSVLRDVAGRSKKNQSTFLSALAAVRQNWGIPVIDLWTT
jgi:hypothetical protein